MRPSESPWAELHRSMQPDARSAARPPMDMSRSGLATRAKSCGEQLAVMSNPIEQPGHAIAGGDRRFPAQQTLGLADVGDEDPLVARTPVRVRGPQWAAH